MKCALKVYICLRTSNTKMAATTGFRCAFQAVRLSSVLSNSSKTVARPLSTSTAWFAESGVTKKVDSDDITKANQDRKKKMAGLITVEGAGKCQKYCALILNIV